MKRNRFDFFLVKCSSLYVIILENVHHNIENEDKTRDKEKADVFVEQNE